MVAGAAAMEPFQLLLHARGGKPGSQRAPVSHQPDAINPFKGLICWCKKLIHGGRGCWRRRRRRRKGPKLQQEGLRLDDWNH